MASFERFNRRALWRILFLLVVGGSLSSVVPITAAAETTPEPQPTDSEPGVARAIGSVTGHITNGTAASSVPAGLKVTLYDFPPQNAPTAVETTASADGSFAFTNVTIYDGHNYLVSAVYRDNFFPGDLLKGDPTQPNLTAPVTIYELTEDPTVLQIVGVDMQVNVANDGMQVLQKTTFHNNSDRLYTSSRQLDNRPTSVVVGLPPGAVITGFSDNPQRFSVAPDNSLVVDTVPVLPVKDHVIQFTYFIPYVSGAIIEQQVYYPMVGDLRLWLYPPEITAASSQFLSVGSETIGSTTYQRYDGKLTLKSGEVIRYELTGGKTATTPQRVIPTNNLPAVFAVLGGMVVLVAVGLLYLRRNTPNDPRRYIDTVVRQIADLDAQHTAGQINHDLYQQQRRALKQQLDAALGDSTDLPSP